MMAIALVMLGLGAGALVILAASDALPTASPHGGAAASEGPNRHNGPDRQNRLIHQSSPYLLQHASNPVDWYPWGEEAFARARAEDKPIFLSVGYSTCHWCHVMAHESFEDLDVAAVLNKHFIAIKVDREQRPDLDNLYMRATQAFTGGGGWPNSVWLTPDGRPWFAGTYFPRHGRGGQIGFEELLRQLADLWAHRRADVEAQATQLAEAVRRGSLAEPSDADVPSDREAAEHLMTTLAGGVDPQHGGWAGAPKFPPHHVLRFLLYEARTRGDARALQWATTTLDAMALGGLHDHLAGGFHRYATDVAWRVPHFEKMLYDNAQLGRLYVEAWTLTGYERYREVARRLFDWVLDDLSDDAGGFHCAWDADSEGVEGRFYLWSLGEILDVLGDELGRRVARRYNVTEAGNYRDEASGRRTGVNILHLNTIEELTADGAMDAARRRLRDRRRGRVRPSRDDKVLAGWNGLMIGALACAGHHLGEPRYIDAARRAASFARSTLRHNRRLHRSYRAGAATGPAFLDDYAFLADGLLDLHDATGEARWLADAQSLATTMSEDFADAAGGFFFVAHDHEDLLARGKTPTDAALPSGNGVAARVLMRLAERTGEQRYGQQAGETLRAFWPTIRRAGHVATTLVLATTEWMDRRRVETGRPRAEATGVAVDAIGPAAPVPAGGHAAVTLRLTVEDGYHVNSATPRQGHRVATAVAVTGEGPVTLGPVDYPPGEPLATGVTDEPLSVYTGTVDLPLRLTIAPHARPGRHNVPLAVRLQACDRSRCLPPTALALTVGVDVVTAT
ncbi:MAG: DUF255 domain-containing protein [Planctomycetota bacterium]